MWWFKKPSSALKEGDFVVVVHMQEDDEVHSHFRGWQEDKFHPLNLDQREEGKVGQIVDIRDKFLWVRHLDNDAWAPYHRHELEKIHGSR